MYTIVTNKPNVQFFPNLVIILKDFMLIYHKLLNSKINHFDKLKFERPKSRVLLKSSLWLHKNSLLFNYLKIKKGRLGLILRNVNNCTNFLAHSFCLLIYSLFVKLCPKSNSFIFLFDVDYKSPNKLIIFIIKANIWRHVFLNTKSK